MFLKFVLTFGIVTFLILFFRSKTRRSFAPSKTNIVMKRKNTALNANELQLYSLLMEVCNEHSLSALPNFNLISLIKSPNELSANIITKIASFPCSFLIIDRNNTEVKLILSFCQDENYVKEVSERLSIQYQILSPSLTYTRDTLKHILYSL